MKINKDIVIGILSTTLLITSIALLCTGCNKQIIDTKWNFTKAIIDDVGEVSIKSWNDYENSDMIQITTTDGTTYLTHSSKVILISE